MYTNISLRALVIFPPVTMIFFSAAVLQLQRTIDVAKKERRDNVTVNACTRRDLHCMSQ